MLTIRKSNERGVTNIDWLQSYHSFSFSHYYDPRHMGFRTLRVINDDIIGAGGGFGMHPHRDMEIITYTVEGALEHKDSMGNGSVIRPGDVQYMSAGTGVRHSEFNPSKTEDSRIIQIWILPERDGLTPTYGQKSFTEAERRNALRLLTSHDGRDGSIRIAQDAELYGALLDENAEVTHNLQPGRHAWLQVVKGNLTVNGQPLTEGDAVAVSQESAVTVRGGSGGAEVLLFDLA